MLRKSGTSSFCHSHNVLAKSSIRHNKQSKFVETQVE